MTEWYSTNNSAVFVLLVYSEDLYQISVKEIN